MWTIALVAWVITMLSQTADKHNNEVKSGLKEPQTIERMDTAKNISQ